MPPDKSNNESIVAYFSDGHTMHYSKDETVIDGLNEPEGVYLIKKGFVKAYSLSESGDANLLLIHDSGEIIPLPWALDGAHTTGLYYVAMGPVTILRTSKDRLRTAMGNNGWLSQEVLRQAVNTVTIYTKRIQTLEFRSARGRIIAELLNLAERFGRVRDGHVYIHAPITHQDLADSINMSRETASRSLEKLFQEKLIDQKRHFFVILDLEQLHAALK